MVRAVGPPDDNSALSGSAGSAAANKVAVTEARVTGTLVRRRPAGDREPAGY